MTRTFDRWVDIETASDYELDREFDETLKSLAYDLKVCGQGYPSPRKQTLRDIAAELARREAARHLPPLR